MFCFTSLFLYSTLGRKKKNSFVYKLIAKFPLLENLIYFSSGVWLFWCITSSFNFQKRGVSQWISTFLWSIRAPTWCSGWMTVWWHMSGGTRSSSPRPGSTTQLETAPPSRYLSRWCIASLALVRHFLFHETILWCLHLAKWLLGINRIKYMYLCLI